MLISDFKHEHILTGRYFSQFRLVRLLVEDADLFVCWHLTRLMLFSKLASHMEQWGSPDQDHCLRSAGNLPAIAKRSGLYCNLACSDLVHYEHCLCYYFQRDFMKIIDVLIDITNIFTFHKKRSNGVWYFFPASAKMFAQVHCIIFVLLKHFSRNTFSRLHATLAAPVAVTTSW